jgi:hypothetical protein
MDFYPTDKAKDLTAWVYNNWRLCKAAKKGYGRGTVRVNDIVRKTKREAIHEELKKILGREDIDPASQEYFEQHNRAVSQVMKKLSEADYAELEATAKEWNEKGSPPEEQRRYVVPLQHYSPLSTSSQILNRKADKHGWKRVEDEDLQRFRDMGMVSLTFVVYHSPDGQLRIRW